MEGHYIVLTKSWAKSFMIRMGFVKRKGSTAAKLLGAQFEKRKEQLFDIRAAVVMNDIPPSGLALNILVQTDIVSGCGTVCPDLNRIWSDKNHFTIIITVCIHKHDNNQASQSSNSKVSSSTPSLRVVVAEIACPWH